MPPPKNRGRRKPIHVGLFEEDAKRIERQRQWSRDYYWRHRELELSRAKSERRKAQRRAWVLANRAKVTESSRKWRKKNAAKLKARESLRKRDADKIKRYTLKRTYGVTLEWFQATLAAQDKRCAICNREFGDSREESPRVDHNHSTGAVRGVLCNKCNRAIGFFDENLNALRSAIAYLERHNPCRAAS
jgi:hypothetical protein